MGQDNDILHQIEQFHSEWSKMELAGKIGFLMSKQRELNLWANALSNNRALRGYFTPEEIDAVRQLQDVQNVLNCHKSEVHRDLYNEIRKELLKLFFNPQ